MRKISWMYQQSGGALPFHTCGECQSLRPVRGRGKEASRCLRYERQLKKQDQDAFRRAEKPEEALQTPREAFKAPEEVLPKSSWKRSWVACRAFQGQKELFRIAAAPAEEERPSKQELMEKGQLPGQLSLTDYPGVMPG